MTPKNIVAKVKVKLTPAELAKKARHQKLEKQANVIKKRLKMKGDVKTGDLITRAASIGQTNK